VEVVRRLHRLGFSFRDIARCTGVGYGTVRRAYHGLAPLGADLLARSGTVTGSLPDRSAMAKGRLPAARSATASTGGDAGFLAKSEVRDSLGRFA
jgi:hypothetical protein